MRKAKTNLAMILTMMILVSCHQSFDYYYERDDCAI